MSNLRGRSPSDSNLEDHAEVQQYVSREHSLHQSYSKSYSQDQIIKYNERSSSKNQSINQEYQQISSREDNEQNQGFEAGLEVIRFSRSSQRPENEQTLASSIPAQKVYPWLNQKTKSIENSLIKLHNQIIDFFLMFQEQQQTHNHLLQVYNRLQGVMFKTFRNCDILAPFLTSRVYLKNSEVQIFILFDQAYWKSPQTIEKVKLCLQKCNLHMIHFFEVPAPQKTNKQHKVGFNCFTQQINYPIQIKLVSSEWTPYVSMISDMLQNNLQSKFLYLIFDAMIRQRGLQNAVKGYLVFGLIGVFLHQRKRQKSRSLTENILKFLEYFGVGPFTERKIIYVGKNEFQVKQEQLQNMQNPNNLVNSGQFSFWISQNIDISNHMIKEFFSIIRNRYRLISNYNFAGRDSVLAALINPIYDEFRY